VILDICDFSNRLAEAIKTMPADEKAFLTSLFESAAKNIVKEETVGNTELPTNENDVPNGMTQRLERLKANYLKHVPQELHIKKTIAKSRIKRFYYVQSVFVIAVRLHHW
jgi:hypothetical protein